MSRIDERLEIASIILVVVAKLHSLLMSAGISIVPPGFELTAHPVFFRYKPSIVCEKITQAVEISPQNSPSSRRPTEVTLHGSNEEDAAICGICLDSYKDPTTLGNCSHSFCFECIVQWFHVKTACPTCTVQTAYIIRTCEFSQRHPRGFKVMRLVPDSEVTTVSKDEKKNDNGCLKSKSNLESKAKLKRAVSAHVMLLSHNHSNIQSTKRLRAN
jgi:hypothetical protein